MAGETDRRGGGNFVFVGEAGRARESVKKETGEVSWYLEVTYWGGSQSIKLAMPEQRGLLTQGQWVRIECPIKRFNDDMYAGPGVITQIDGKPVPAPTAAR